MNDVRTIMRVEDLRMHFPIRRGFLPGRDRRMVRAVDGVTLNVRRGETLGLVGESGSGKTTLGRTVMRLYESTGGKIIFDDLDITNLNGAQIRALRRRMRMIFQDPYSSLNPRMSVGTIVGEPLMIHRLASGVERENRVRQLLRIVGLSPGCYDRYPHEFSGGQRQRIGIARALSTEPDFLVCDEPISSLDVSVQAQIVNLLRLLKEKLNLTLLFISHDLSMVRHISDRVAVMYLGKIVELASCDELFRDPWHPYTRSLLSAIPMPDPALTRKRERVVLTGEVPNPADPPPGCNFNTRCPLREDQCFQSEPVLREIKPGHHVACHVV